MDHEEKGEYEPTKGTQLTFSNWLQRNGDLETVQQRIQNNCFKDAQRAKREYR